MIPDPRVADLVQAALARWAVPHRVIDCDPAFADTAAFCARYGYPLSMSANTILVASKTEPRRYGACLLTADSRLDVNRTVRTLLGARKASFADAEETLALTGMAIGGVTVFGLPDGLSIYVDPAVMAQPEVIVGSGTRSGKIVLAPAGLLRLPGVEIVEGLATPVDP